jgi:predicted glycosyltransferase
MLNKSSGGEKIRIILDVAHPAQVHFHRNSVKILEEKGHEVLITARKKDVLVDLLKKYNLEYTIISTQKTGFFGLFSELIQRCYLLRKIVRNFQPDLMYSAGETASIVGKLEKVPTIVFNDSEPVPLNKILTYPWTNTICTPSTFTKELSEKQVKYNGYKELAYLHPNYFSADPAIYTELGLKPEEKFVLMRFVAWNALHDVGKHGFELKYKIKLVSELQQFATVFITSESSIPEKLQKYKLPISPEKIHHALYFASLYVGDSQTMATEAGVLGTPAIRCNSFVGKHDMGNFIELEKKYGLIFNYRNQADALNKAIELVQRDDLKEEWKQKRTCLLNEKIDVNRFIVWFIENYPESFRIMKDKPEVQYQFKSGEKEIK